MTKPAFIPEPESDATTAGNRGGVGQMRREQIIDAAIEIIVTQGIPKLSLGNIEHRVKMTRGHLTYYFPTKEAILLAVFDRMLRRMREEKLTRDGPKPGTGQAWECLQAMFADAVKPLHSEMLPFLSLVHTFYAQLTYREDFRQKIAEAQADWRDGISADYAQSVPNPPVRPEIMASLCMAIVQGLSGQLAVDPNAFDRDEMLATLQRFISPFFHSQTVQSQSNAKGDSDE